MIKSIWIGNQQGDIGMTKRQFEELLEAARYFLGAEVSLNYPYVETRKPTYEQIGGDDEQLTGEEIILTERKDRPSVEFHFIHDCEAGPGEYRVEFIFQKNKVYWIEQVIFFLRDMKYEIIWHVTFDDERLGKLVSRHVGNTHKMRLDHLHCVAMYCKKMNEVIQAIDRSTLICDLSTTANQRFEIFCRMVKALMKDQIVFLERRNHEEGQEEE